MVSLGFGYRLGIDLPGEKRGYIPNSGVYDKFYKGAWNGHTIISIAIGQGEVLATPLQIANLAALIANRGYYIRPHVVHSIGGMPLDSMYHNHQPSGISRGELGVYRRRDGRCCHGRYVSCCELRLLVRSRYVVRPGTAENPPR